MAAPPPPVLTLAVEKGPRAGETRQCRAGVALRVGRVVSGNDLAVLRDVGASQRHLAIEFLPPPAARWAVSDLGSSNGARLEPSAPAPLSHGDLIVLGETTELAVSRAPDSEVKPAPAPRRSSRRAAPTTKAVEEKPTPSVIRRSTRKKAGAAAEPYEDEKEGPDAVAVVVVEEEKPQMVTRRSRRNKAAAAESQEAGREEIEEAGEEARRGRKKKAVEPPEPEKAEEQKQEKAAVVTRRTRRKNAEPSELEKAEEGKDAVPVAPPPLPPKTRSRRARGRVTMPCAMETVLEEEEEMAAPREEKGDKVAVGHGEVEGTAEALDEVPVAPRGRARRAPKGMANAQCAASDNVGKEIKGGGQEEEDGEREAIVGEGKLGGVENLEEHAGRSTLETMPVAWREQARRAPKGMANAQFAAYGNGGEEIKGGGEEEHGDKTEAVDNGGEVEDVEKADTRAGRSSLETMPFARREQAQRAPKEMTNAQCAAFANVGEDIKGVGEEEEDGKREVIVSAGMVGDVDCAGRSSLETMPVAGREQAQGAPKGMASAQCAASDNRGQEIKGSGEEEDDDKTEAVDNGEEVGDVEKVEKRAGRSSLETMTLGEWFDRMEKYLPRMINEAADEMIATMEEQHRRINEYIMTLESSSNTS